MRPTPKLSFRKREDTKHIILHASHTVPDPERPLYAFLEAEGRRRGLLEVGYHFLIRAGGLTLDCRPHDTIGSHTRGYNRYSIGVCLEGGMSGIIYPTEIIPVAPADTFDDDQHASLQILSGWLDGLYGKPLPVVAHTQLQGHQEGEGRSACPPFEDTARWTTNLHLPPRGPLRPPTPS